ncbi:hypothetical protein BC832DRAFT_619418 [Gaertneriomyces semiglobifer]|nr:hypothetical protein BC832DRAFT_619418 [Gaertneriomyces semiglobifer]
MPNEFHHRSSLKQQNKGFKSKHSTKGQQKAKNKGKVDQVANSIKHKSKAISTKADRRNQAKLRQQSKRSELVHSNRLFQGISGAPRIIAFVPLCPDVNTDHVVRDIYSSVGQEYVPQEYGRPATLYVERFKQNLQLVPVKRHLLHILDMAKVADFIVFVMSAHVEVDTFGELCLSTIKTQGVPSTVSVVQHLETITPIKKQTEIRKSLMEYMEHHFPADDAKVFSTSVGESEVLHFVRFLTQQRVKPVSWRERHAYMLPDAVGFTASGEDPTRGTLMVTGFVRGNYLSANRLVHVPNVGDFQIQKIVSAGRTSISSSTTTTLVTSTTAHQKRETDMTMEMDMEEGVLDVPDPQRQESLVAENEPDPMEGEQTWPTEQELKDAEDRVQMQQQQQRQGKKKKKMVPRGTSAYQAAWIMDDDDEEDEEEGDEDEGYEDDANDMDMGPTVDWGAMNLGHGNTPNGQTPVDNSNDSGSENEDLVELDASENESNTGKTHQQGEEEDEDMYDTLDAEAEAEQYAQYLAKQAAERSDLEFPDEVDTPKDVPARIRFQKYRGLKSFRTSPWDPYENLPVDYSRIFQFQNFKRTKTKVFSTLDEEGVAPGTRVTVYIADVPLETAATTKPLVMVSLLPHEHKISVLNFSITRNPEYTAPVKSKDVVVLMCGMRRYVVKPLYSTATRGGSNNVHKFERFLLNGRISFGTVYAPIQYGPAPITIFRWGEDWDRNILWGPTTTPPLIGTGAVMDLDPTRILAKRLVLTGHPFKIHKRSAVFRFMFWNREDILWFKPVQVTTKMGRVGHIREPLGMRGYMKVAFDGMVGAQDTVCMNLYKRVFPKWGVRGWR